MNASHEPQPHGYPWWQWILAVLTFFPLFPMLIATVAPGTRATLTPKRVWAGYALFTMVGFMALIVIFAIVGPDEPSKQAVTSEPTTEAATRSVPVAQTGLGIPRFDFIEALYQSFTFDEPTRRDDGLYVVRGESNANTSPAFANVIGPPENIIQIQYGFIVPDDPSQTLTHLVNMNLLVSRVFPRWKETDTWLAGSVQGLLDRRYPNDRVTYERDGKVVTLGLNRLVGMLSMEVAPHY